jgi:hypothetical protein
MKRFKGWKAGKALFGWVFTALCYNHPPECCVSWETLPPFTVAFSCLRLCILYAQSCFKSGAAGERSRRSG